MLVVLIISSIFIENAQSARILGIFPSFSISHQLVFRPLSVELASRGHEVVVITPLPAFPRGQAPKNLIEIDVGNVTQSYLKEINPILDELKGDFFELAKKLAHSFVTIFEKQTQADDVQNMINDGREFDLIISEAGFRSSLVFSHVYKVPIISFSSYSSIYDYEILGSPSYTLLYPSTHASRCFNMSIWDSIVQLYSIYKIQTNFESKEYKENEMFKRVFGADAPPLADLYNNIHMAFLNVDRVWELNRPVPLNTLLLGRLHLEHVDYNKLMLPQDLQNYLDSSKNGVVYVSFGTYIQTDNLPPEKLQILLKVFSQLPYNVLWKWDKHDHPGKADNIKIWKWFPQADLLRHPNIKLFITHGGLQSINEAIVAGVPLIGFPMLFDQFANMEKCVHFRIGIQLDINTVTEQQLNTSINAVFGDESYRRHVMRLRELTREQRQRPLERAVWWVEYVLKHGGVLHLRAPAANMPWTHYFELELTITVLIVLLLISYLLKYTICLVFNY